MTHGFYASPIPGMHRLAHMQVKAACARGLKCEVYNSTVDRSSKAAIISDLCSGAPSTRLLYSTPESLAMPRCASPLMRRTASASGADDFRRGVKRRSDQLYSHGSARHSMQNRR